MGVDVLVRSGGKSTFRTHGGGNSGGCVLKVEKEISWELQDELEYHPRNEQHSKSVLKNRL